MNIKESFEFKKDLKKLLKRYKTLEKDLEVAKLAIATEPLGDGSRHWIVITRNERKYLIKMRMMCRAVKGSTFRLVYFYDADRAEVLLIELFYKGYKSTPNSKRMDKVVKELMD